MTAYDIIYNKEEGVFKNGEFVIQKTSSETHTVFANSEKEARKKFVEETKFGSHRIKEVKPAAGNFLGNMFPGLAELKNSMSQEVES